MVRISVSQFTDNHCHFPQPSGRRHMIMIVEDEAGAGASLERAIRCAGHEALAIPSAFEALTLLHIYKPRLLLVDLDLPVMSGLSFIRAVRSDSRYLNVPIIVYSADFSASTQREAIAAGAQRYLVKGTISIDALIDHIKETLDSPAPPLRFTHFMEDPTGE